MFCKCTCCCKIKILCGYSLHKAVAFVGIASIIISTTILVLSSWTVWKLMDIGIELHNNPVLATDLLFSLFSCSISAYQILISFLLYAQAYWLKGDTFLCWLWYVSHLSIMVLYFFFFAAKAIICLRFNEIYLGMVTVIIGVIYEGIFIQFSIIVNSFTDIIDDDVYY